MTAGRQSRALPGAPTAARSLSPERPQLYAYAASADRAINSAQFFRLVSAKETAHGAAKPPFQTQLLIVSICQIVQGRLRIVGKNGYPRQFSSTIFAPAGGFSRIRFAYASRPSQMAYR